MRNKTNKLRGNLEESDIVYKLQNVNKQLMTHINKDNNEVDN